MNSGIYYNHNILAVYSDLIVLALIFAFGFVIVTYEQFAVRRTWFIEPSLCGNSAVKLAEVFSIFMAPGLAFQIMTWGESALVVITGLLLFPALVQLSRSRAQYLTAGGLIVCWIIFLAGLARD